MLIYCCVLAEFLNAWRVNPDQPDATAEQIVDRLVRELGAAPHVALRTIAELVDIAGMKDHTVPFIDRYSREVIDLDLAIPNVRNIDYFAACPETVERERFIDDLKVRAGMARFDEYFVLLFGRQHSRIYGQRQINKHNGISELAIMTASSLSVPPL